MSIITLSKVPEQIQMFFRSQHKAALAGTTKASYTGVAFSKLIPFCEEKGILELDESFSDRMDELVEWLRFKNISARTIQSYLTVIKSFLRFYGHEIKYTYRIPRAAKQENDLKHENRWFSAEDIAYCKTYVFDKKHTRNHCLVRIMVETGARVDEIAHIRASDVRISEKTILLSHSKTIPRPVFFSQETAIYLNKYLKGFYLKPGAEHKKIFPGKNMIYKLVTKMLKDLDLKQKNDGRGPHTFRHYTATYLRYVLGMDLDHVAKLLGDTPATISQNYLHPTANMLHSLMGKASGW